LIGVTMSDQQFAILIGVVIGAVWWLSREIRQATWNATPEAAKWREEAAKHTRFVEVKNKERAARRNKWAACLSRMKAAFPGWMFKETPVRARRSYYAPRRLRPDLRLPLRHPTGVAGIVLAAHEERAVSDRRARPARALAREFVRSEA
jgi:hypothetical protein